MSIGAIISAPRNSSLLSNPKTSLLLVFPNANSCFLTASRCISLKYILFITAYFLINAAIEQAPQALSTKAAQVGMLNVISQQTIAPHRKPNISSNVGPISERWNMFLLLNHVIVINTIFF